MTMSNLQNLMTKWISYKCISIFRRLINKVHNKLAKTRQLKYLIALKTPIIVLTNPLYNRNLSPIL